MNHVSIIIGSVVFIIAGLLFIAAAFYIRRSDVVKRFPLLKPASFIFYLIGALTVVYGILGFSFLNELTKKAVQLAALIYLFLITIAFSVFYLMLKNNNSGK